MADVSKITASDGVSYDILSKTTRGIVIATMDSGTSATNFKVTATGITALYDGLTIMCKNTNKASATGFTVNLNNLGAKRARSSNSNGYATTEWALNTSFIFTYDLANDWWIIYKGYDSNSGGTVKTVKVNSTSYTPNSSGLVTLPDYPTVPTNVSSFTNDSGYITMTHSFEDGEAFGAYIDYDSSLSGFTIDSCTVGAVGFQCDWNYSTTDPNFIIGAPPTRCLKFIKMRVSWPSGKHSTGNLEIGEIYPDCMKPVRQIITTGVRDNGSGGKLDSARIIIETSGKIYVCPIGGTSTAFADYHRVNFTASYI